MADPVLEDLLRAEQAATAFASSVTTQASVTKAAAEATRRLTDAMCALWVTRAPRFGAVAALFPRSLRCRRFVASFWAPEVLLFGCWYWRPREGTLTGRTRSYLDEHLAEAITRATRVCPVDGRRCDGGSIATLLRRCSECPSSRFWSPELAVPAEGERLALDPGEHSTF